MGRDAGCLRPTGSAVMALGMAVSLLLVGVAPAAAARKGTTLAKAPQLVQSGHADFWDCPAKTTELQVAVNTLTLDPGATLDVSFTVRNGGTTSCTYTAPYAGVEPGPTSTALTAGLCGSLGFEVKDGHRHTVWPGAQVVNCPALGLARLSPGATVSGTGSWNQDKPNSRRRVTPGAYRLVIDGTQFSFPFHVARS